MNTQQLLYKLSNYVNPIFWYHYYFYETIFVITVILFIVQYQRGTKQNKNIAQQHLKSIGLELEKHFKNVGNKEIGVLYEADNPHTFKLYASSHQIMKFGLVGLYLHKRENLFYNYGYSFIIRQKERVVFEIGIQPQFRQLICFGIVKQTQIKRIKKEGYEDLKNICHTITIPHLDQELSVLTEYDEIAQNICTQEIIQLLNINSKLIHIIYISDVDRDPACKISVKILMNLQQNADYSKIIELVIALSLQISQIKMDLKKINKAGHTRRKFNSKFKD